MSHMTLIEYLCIPRDARQWRLMLVLVASHRASLAATTRGLAALQAVSL